MSVDVVVVGAGLAGLVTARDVVAAGRTAIVLEARERVGGRLLNEPIGEGDVVEVGGQWVGPGQDRVNALIAELGLQTYPTYAEGDNLLLWQGGHKRYRGAIPKINPAVLLDIGQAQARLDRMAKQVPLHAPWEAKKAAEWDSQTFRTWMDRTALTGPARTLLRIAIEAVWAQEPEDVSLLHVLFYTHSAGGFDRLIGTEGGAQQDRIVGGSQRIALELAARLPEGTVRTGSPVRRIEHGPDGVTVHCDTGVFEGRRAVLALPPTLTPRIAFAPALPGHRDQLVQRMPQGTVAKCMAVYDEPFWRAEGLSGQALSDRGPCHVLFDNSPPSGSPGVLLGFLEGRGARELGGLPAAERRRLVLEGFAGVFGPQAAEPTRYIEKLWAEEEWTRGCYGCAMTTGAWTGFGSALRAPIGPLGWAGAETAEVWSGYMDGAVRSGERAAAEALAAM